MTYMRTLLNENKLQWYLWTMQIPHCIRFQFISNDVVTFGHKVDILHGVHPVLNVYIAGLGVKRILLQADMAAGGQYAPKWPPQVTGVRYVHVEISLVCDIIELRSTVWYRIWRSHVLKVVLWFWNKAWKSLKWQ